MIKKWKILFVTGEKVSIDAVYRHYKRSFLKKALFCGVFFLLMTILATQAPANSGRYDFIQSSLGFTAQQFENTLKEYLSTPYKKGGTSKRGMDCSGFSKTIYARFFGIQLPHSSKDQYHSSLFQQIDVKKMQPGDLLFFANAKKQRINHVGIYISDRQFIHASRSKGVIVSSLDNRYWKKHFVGSKRYVIPAVSIANGRVDDERLQRSFE